MTLEQWLLPTSILAIKFLFMVVVDRKVDLPECIIELIALPVDIALLAISLLAGLVILDPENISVGLGLFVTAICVAVLAVFIWRRSQALFDREKIPGAILLFTVNTLLTGSALIYVLHLLGEGSLT